ncbi:acyloxyacyl hydrolase [Xylophilus rhododendri]|uniref:Acyloxyacyl hydrolase n=1 Tax=Xylophilus rhododendri TaxID=2697032 RepID=A0A857J7T4_9BURK|nr:acyloxyacyl hydrolase [Xylophilus rhododendri]QHI98845.1 acyloxyacyl hydrolase [Xylophilus rhododendri]
MIHFSLLSIASALALAAVAPLAHADASASNGIYLQYGKAGSDSNTNAYTLGVTKPMDWFGSRTLWGTQATGFWDLYGTYHVSDRNNGGEYKTWLAGLTPTFRLRFDEGRSNWFVDGGVGVSYTDVLYRSNAGKEFSTRFNFGSHVALGYTFGAQREQEISVSFLHYSNASIKKPNPGENYVQLRYAHSF